MIAVDREYETINYLIDESQVSVRRYCIVDAQFVSGNIADPNEASSRLPIKRCDSSMASAKNICIINRSVCHFGEGWHSCIAQKLEHMCWMLNNCEVLAMAGRKRD